MFDNQGKVWGRKNVREKIIEENQVDRMRGGDIYEYV